VVAQPEPIHGLPLAELSAFFGTHNLSTHQARLTFQAMHRHGQLTPDEMPGISDKCRRFLETRPPLPTLALDATQAAPDGTLKLRLTTPRGDAVECVLIPAARRVTLCVSCQIGCAAACAFCHTGTMGLRRNLEAWEIVEQYRIAREVWLSQSTIQNLKSTITNVVFMGMGEPLHNEANVVRACRILGADIGAGFSRRRLVVSSVGVGDRIRPFWEANAASLLLSLHATTDETRNRLIPLNRRWNLAALREILLSIPWRRGETVFIAYLLLDGVNDTHDYARRLAAWTRGLPAKINLLEFNPYPGSAYQRASAEKLARFRQWLHDCGVFHTLRHSRGGEASAACGQLALMEDKGKRQK
jgi:23S rRNA (adenine2503-C2)-methyltransferase